MTGDIAQFTEEQKYTYQMIGAHISLLEATNTTENNSTLTNSEIQAQIMEQFIIKDFSYCNSWIDNQYAGYCGDNGSTAITLGNKIVQNEFIKIVKENQPTPFDGLFKFFGSLIMPSTYAQEHILVYAQPATKESEEDRIKALTNYDKILRSITDECSVKSRGLGVDNQLTLEER